MMQESIMNSMWGVPDVFESSQGRAYNDRISNGGPMKDHIIDYPRKLDRLASFNEECQKIQLAADLAMCRADTRETRFSNLIQEVMSIENHKNNQMIVKRLQHEKTESDLFHHPVKTQYTARNKGKKSAHKSSLCRGSASLVHRPPSIPAGTYLNKFMIGEILGAICTQDADLKMKHVQRRAKAFVDQMFIDRRFTERQETSSDCKPFSDALEVLSTNKDLFMEFLPEPNPMLARFIKPVLDAKFSACESTYDTSSENRKFKKPFLEKIDRKCQYSSKTNFTRHLDKIVVLKPAPQKIRYSENITCHCSSVQSYQQLGGKVPNPKPTSFSFKEMKRKLQHTFGSNRKGTKQISVKGNSKKLAYNRSILGVGNCICRGTDTLNSFSASKNVEIRENLKKKLPLRSIDRLDNICMKETVRKKIDFPSVSLSMKQEFDVIFEGKRQLYARVNDANALENAKGKRFPKSPAQILSSPEHDFWPISLKEDSLYGYGSGQMRFSTHSNSPSIIRRSCLITNERQEIGLSPLRPNKEVTFNDDNMIYEGTIETLGMKTISSVIRATDGHEHCTILSETYEEDFNNGETKIRMSTGETKIEEIDSIQKHELCLSEVESETTITVKRSDVTESPGDDESAVHFVDSHSENETLASTLDDIPFTPLSSCDSTKYQEEHRSPVSVLEPFFTDDTNSPPSTTFQTAERSLQPLRLDFEECSFDSPPQDPQLDSKTCKNEQDHISLYVHLVLQASCMNWDHLSKTSQLPEELIHESLFDELEFPLIDPNLNPKLLFDHIIEVLLEIYQWNFSSPLLAFIKPKIMCLALEEVVLEEIMKEADFYVLPQTEKRTLNQIVSRDIANSRTWLDVRHDTEQVVIQVSEDFIEELILDVLLEFHT